VHSNLKTGLHKAVTGGLLQANVKLLEKYITKNRFRMGMLDSNNMPTKSNIPAQ
jgi:hypothetical protein